MMKVGLKSFIMAFALVIVLPVALLLGFMTVTRSDSVLADTVIITVWLIAFVIWASIFWGAYRSFREYFRRGE